jgi:hypothetical protein
MIIKNGKLKVNLKKLIMTIRGRMKLEYQKALAIAFSGKAI